MSSETEVHTLSFRFPDYSVESKLIYQCKVLAFPQKWKGFIDDLGREPEWKNKKKYPPSGSSLKKLLLALLPELTVVDFNLDSSRWAYSTNAIDVNAVHRIVSVWIEKTFSECIPKATIQHKLEQIKADDLQWENASFNLAETICNEFGTAGPKHSEGYALLPDLLGDALTRSHKTLPYGSYHLNFYRSPIVGRNGIGSGLELFSWLPLEYRTKRHSHPWFYSPLLTLTLQTIPFQSFPVMHVDVGLRRWVSIPGANLDYDDHNLYLLPRLASEEMRVSSRRFQTASIKRRKDITKPAGEGYYWDWADSLPSLFAEYFPESPLPDPHEVLRDPAIFINGDHKLQVAIPYHNRMWHDHVVGTGSQPRERKQLADSIAEILYEEFGLITTGTLQRVKDRGKEVRNRKSIFHESVFEKDGRQKTDRLKANAHGIFAQRRLATASSVRLPPRIEVRYISGEVRDALLKAMSDVFDQPTTNLPGCWSWETEEITIGTSIYPLGDLANKLDDKSSQAFWRRVEDIKRTNQASRQKPDGMLIEIPGKGEFKGELDPKDALRVAQAQDGVLTQFINPQPEDGLEIRAEKAVLDLLRQLGVVDGLPEITPQAFPLEVDCAAFWILKTDDRSREFLPMMVYLPLKNPRVLAIAHGLRDFVPYSQFLSWLTQRRSPSGKSITDSTAPKWLNWQDRSQIGGIIKDWLMNRLPQHQDLLLMTHAQNSRSYWNWLTNNGLTCDSIYFEPGISTDASEFPNLRVVRVRESNEGETPQVFAISSKDKKKMSYTTGVFRLSDRTLYSIPEKPASRRNQKPDKPKSLNPEMQGWNPTLLEMVFPVLQGSDNGDPTRWALLTHKLRRAAFHFAHDLALPLPLHLSQKADEYVFSQYFKLSFPED
jgi:hypothetical protein